MLHVPPFSATFDVEYLSQRLLFIRRHVYARTRAHLVQGTFDRRRGAERAVWELLLNCTIVIHFVMTCHLLDLCCCFVSFLFSFYSQIYWKADTGWGGGGRMLPTHLCRIVAFSQVMSSLVQLMSTCYCSFNYVITITMSQNKWLHLLGNTSEALTQYPSHLHPSPCFPPAGADSMGKKSFYCLLGLKFSPRIPQ